jgi:CubicO group peptidase (beta-lactamase class C family)
MTNTGIEYFNKVIPNKSMIYHKNANGKISLAEQTNLSDRVPGGGLYSTISDIVRFGDSILNFSLIKESTFQMMVENPNLKTEGNGYGMGWYLYGKNPIYGEVYGHNGTQTGASTFLMLLPERKTTIVVLANTSGAMQTASDISIKLFDVATESKK